MQSMKILLTATLLIFINNITTYSSPNIIDYDLSEFYSNENPLINYEKFFGNIINAYTFFQKVDKQNFLKFKYEFDENHRVVKKLINDKYSNDLIIKKYKYNNQNQIQQIKIVAKNFEKTLILHYANNRLAYIQERINHLKNSHLENEFDYLIYKFDDKGRIYVVLGINETFFGLFKKQSILKIYDYFENNRLKSIRDFKNPEKNIIILEDKYVNNS